MTLFIEFSLFLFLLVPGVPGFPTPPPFVTRSAHTPMVRVVARHLSYSAYPLTENREQDPANSKNPS
jgi:hypothetical protein